MGFGSKFKAQIKRSAAQVDTQYKRSEQQVKAQAKRSEQDIKNLTAKAKKEYKRIEPNLESYAHEFVKDIAQKEIADITAQEKQKLLDAMRAAGFGQAPEVKAEAAEEVKPEPSQEDLELQASLDKIDGLFAQFEAKGLAFGSQIVFAKRLLAKQTEEKAFVQAVHVLNIFEKFEAQKNELNGTEHNVTSYLKSELANALAPELEKRISYLATAQDGMTEELARIAKLLEILKAIAPNHPSLDELEEKHMTAMMNHL